MNMFMNQSTCFQHSNQRLLEPQNQSRAFTLTELAVVIATIAVLTALVLPALAGVANKGGRMQCANNLRQIYVASMIYATEYRDWLPINQVHTGSAYVNKLYGTFYTYYVLSPSGPSPAGVPDTFVPTNAPAAAFSDLGLLYHASLAGNGSIFYCPDAWGTFVGANNYLPLLTTEAGDGRIRSSYAFNPRIVDPANGNVLRLYQKTSDLPPHKLFAVDYFGGGGGASSAPHSREGGWNVLFTDGSVQFSQNAVANNLIQNFSDQEAVASYEAADQIFNCLELDH